MTPPPHVELEGELVRLRPVCADDAEPAFPMVHGRREILDWLIWPGPESVEELREGYRVWWRGSEDEPELRLAIVERAADAFVGSMGVRFQGPATADLGYWLAVERWGRGYVSEAVRLTCHLAFAHLGAALLTARVFDGNDASRRVLEKSGFRPDWRSTTTLRGRTVAQTHLGLSRHAWEAANAGWRPPREIVRATDSGSRRVPGGDRGPARP